MKSEKMNALICSVSLFAPFPDARGGTHTLGNGHRGKVRIPVKAGIGKRPAATGSHTVRAGSRLPGTKKQQNISRSTILYISLHRLSDDSCLIL